MKKNQKSNIVIKGQQVNVALGKGKINAKQITSANTEKKHCFFSSKFLSIILISIVAIGMIVFLCLKINDKNLAKNNEIYKNGLLGEAIALDKEMKYWEAAVVYSKLYGSWENATDYQLEMVKFLEGLDYFYLVMINEDKGNQCRYEAIEIFEEIANTNHKENEDMKLLSMGYFLLLTNNSFDIDYEKKRADYCKNLEEDLVNYKTSQLEDYCTYNVQEVCYFALAEYYLKQCGKLDSLQYLKLGISNYQESLKNFRGMMEYEHDVINNKNREIYLLRRLATSCSIAYFMLGDENYLIDAEGYINEIKTKVDINANPNMYIDSMLDVADAEYIIGNQESLEDAYKILNPLFNDVCKDEITLYYIGNSMLRSGVMTGLATENDIRKVKLYNSQMIEKLRNEGSIHEYVNALYEAAYVYWDLAYYYQDREAYNEGYSYLVHIQNAYSGLLESDFINTVLALKETYEIYSEY